MKKGYEAWASKRTIHNIELYTKLIGLFYSSLGLNFFLTFVYLKFEVQFEFAWAALVLSIMMLLLTPIDMTDHRKEHRDLFATVSKGVVHGIGTITCVLVTQLLVLGIIYVLELLIALLLVYKYKQ